MLKVCSLLPYKTVLFEDTKKEVEKVVGSGSGGKDRFVELTTVLCSDT